MLLLSLWNGMDQIYKENSVLSAQNILAVITARGESKGVPRKNIRYVGGYPLIAWTILAALDSTYNLRTVVSTEDTEIASVSREYGAEIPFLRPNYLAEDASTSVETVLHAVDWLARHEHYLSDLIVLLQPTSPFRSSQDIDNAIRLQIESDADAVVSVMKNERPLQWLRRINEDGILADVMSADSGIRRQDAELLYQLNGAIYVIKTDVFLQGKTFYPQKTLAYIMPPDRSLDIDTELDLLVADHLMNDRLDRKEDYS
jgi:CMP-N-acetylneuraminic acid synthetase